MECNGEHEIGLPPTPHKIIEYNHIEKSVVKKTIYKCLLSLWKRRAL
jgi:hypothetical protein